MALARLDSTVVDSTREIASQATASSLAVLNIALKLLALTLALYPLVAPDLVQFQGKWMLPRALSYPLFVLLVPVVWWLRGRTPPYPHFLDVVLATPFVIDMGVNALNLYDTTHADLVAHFVGWAILVAAFGTFISALPISRWNAATLAIGFGATTHVVWEIAEYGMMQFGAFGLNLTYTNTVHDMLCSLLGTLVSAVLTATVLRSGRPLAESRSLIGERSEGTMRLTTEG